MRRSKTVRLTLLAGVAAGAAGCEEAPRFQDTVFRDAAQCVARLGAGSRATCESAFDSAGREHEKIAPRFATVEECHADAAGECRPVAQATQVGAAGAPHGGVHYIPNMQGVLFSRGSGGGYSASPVHERREGGTYVGGAHVGSGRSGSFVRTPSVGAYAAPTSLAATSPAAVVTRGGFGGSAAAHAGGGG